MGRRVVAPADVAFEFIHRHQFERGDAEALEIVEGFGSQINLASLGQSGVDRVDNVGVTKDSIRHSVPGEDGGPIDDDVRDDRKFVIRNFRHDRVSGFRGVQKDERKRPDLTRRNVSVAEVTAKARDNSSRGNVISVFSHIDSPPQGDRTSIGNPHFHVSCRSNADGVVVEHGFLKTTRRVDGVRAKQADVQTL